MRWGAATLVIGWLGTVVMAHPAGPPDPAATLASTLAHMRVDRERRTVEIDGFVPIDAHIPEAPNLYLEVMVSTADVRAHESLVATRASAADVHAALLLIGLEHGSPGSWTWDGTTVTTHAPTGASVEVLFRWTGKDGEQREEPACDWVVSATSGTRLSETIDADETRWVFAGSRMVNRSGREWYAAEAEGTIVGLHTFGSETVAWRGVHSPSAEVEDPEWIADPARLPPRGTEVVVVIRAVEVVDAAPDGEGD